MISKSRMIQFLIVLFIISLSNGCGIAHYNYFRLNKEGKETINGFSFDKFSCGFSVNAKLGRKENKLDSTFHSWFIVEAKNFDCDTLGKMVFDNFKVEYIQLQLYHKVLNLSLLESKRFNKCQFNYYFEPEIIPSDIDSLFFNVAISYLENNEKVFRDTSLILYRHEGKNFYMTN